MQKQSAIFFMKILFSNEMLNELNKKKIESSSKLHIKNGISFKIAAQRKYDCFIIR